MTGASSIADGVSIRRVGRLKESVKQMELGLENHCVVEVIAGFFLANDEWFDHMSTLYEQSRKKQREKCYVALCT